MELNPPAAQSRSGTRPFSLYVHIPYCLHKCPYCDFNSYGIADGKRLASSGFQEAAYTGAVLDELRYYGKDDEAQSRFGGRPVDTVFFGGGTPSLFSPGSLNSLLETIRSLFVLQPEAEITLEANPGTIQEELGREKLRAFREAGVNRISMGVQSFDREKLSFLGRIHDPGDSLRAVENVRAAGFENYNLDLMFGVRGETLGAWKSDLETLLSLSPPHCSAYSLTIEPGTEFGKLARKGTELVADEDAAAEMYELSQSMLGSAGYLQYEVSNFSRPGLHSRHNLAYWSGADYLGVGAGAHSFLAAGLPENRFGRRWSNIPKPEHYIERVRSRGFAVQRTEELSEEQAELEFFFLGLRKSDGVVLSDYELRFGRTFPDSHIFRARKLRDDGLLDIQGLQADGLQPYGFRLTPKGFLFSDHVFRSFSA